jgi:hypothetical protein
MKELLILLDGQIPSEITRAIKFAIRRFHSDTSELLHFVYTTAPMLQAAPGEHLEFGYRQDQENEEVREEPTTESPEPQTDIAAGTAGPIPVKSKTRRKREVEAVRERVQARLRDEKKRRHVETPVPRYDEVFFDGVRRLYGLAGLEIEVSRGEATFSSDVWKSRGRRDPGVP